MLATKHLSPAHSMRQSGQDGTHQNLTAQPESERESEALALPALPSQGGWSPGKTEPVFPEHSSEMSRSPAPLKTLTQHPEVI